MNNALVTKEKGSLSERSIVAVWVVKESVRLYGSTVAVPITKNAASSETISCRICPLSGEQAEKAQLEEEERKRVKLDEKSRIEIKKSKNCLYEQLNEQGKLEEEQLAEQATARELILEASRKLAEAMQGSVSNLQAVKMAQIMLSAGNDKLNATAKQLADIKQHKEKLQQKLIKLVNW